MNYRKLVVFILFLGCKIMLAQSTIVDALRHYQTDDALILIEQYPELKTQEILNWQVDFFTNFNHITSKKNFSKLSIPEDDSLGQFYYRLNSGDLLFYFNKNETVDALDQYLIALQIALDDENRKWICEALKKILTLHRLQYLYQNETFKPYLELYKLYAYDDYEIAYCDHFNLILNFKNYYPNRWDKTSYKTLSKYVQNNKSPFLEGISSNVIASYFEETEIMDSTWHYITKAEKSFESFSPNIKVLRTNQLNAFKARIAVSAAKPDIARAALKNIEEREVNLMDYTSRALKFFYNSVLDTMNNDYKGAYNKYLLYEASIDSVREYRYNNLVNELDAKYQNSEKEKRILIAENDKKRNLNIAIGLGSLLLLGSIIAVLLHRNTKRKQRIAEQAQQLEIQKTEKILKEKEIETINAMVSGQEKERQRLAGELHDNLGSTLATVRMQVENLERNLEKVEDPKSLLAKTNHLINEAYEKVRHISHERNAGVLAKDGLLPAIERLARNVSSEGGLQVDIQDFGLENRLSNEQEITIFRIVQELVTNIIKHAKATEASISLTQHDNELNIMVEDNGKGFKTAPLIHKDGMGLGSIERRVEHLEGSMEVDSSPGNGTNVIIDIPL